MGLFLGDDAEIHYSANLLSRAEQKHSQSTHSLTGEPDNANRGNVNDY